MYITTLSRFLVVGAMLVIAGCAGAPAQLQYAAASSAVIAAPPADAQARLRTCQQFFVELDRVVRRAKVTDSQAAPVPGFPYLRMASVTGLLATFLIVEAMRAPERSVVQMSVPASRSRTRTCPSSV